MGSMGEGEHASMIAQAQACVLAGAKESQTKGRALSSGVNSGRTLSQPSGSLPLMIISNSSASSGYLVLYCANVSLHSASSCEPCMPHIASSQRLGSSTEKLADQTVVRN